MIADFRIKNKRKFIMRKQKKKHSIFPWDTCARGLSQNHAVHACMYFIRCLVQYDSCSTIFSKKPHRLLQTLRHKMWKISVTTPHIPFVFHPCVCSLTFSIPTYIYVHIQSTLRFINLCEGTVATGCVREDL